MNILSLKTPDEINTEIAGRIREIRRMRKMSQETLASRSGVSLGSVKRFESTGQISLISLTKISIALGLDKDLERLFDAPQYSSIEEVIRGQGK